MRKLTITMLLVPIVMLSIPSSALGGSLGYVDCSAGLQTPTMEGGDTEIEFGDVNGDGHVDIVCIGDHGSPYINTSEHGVMVWFGDGTGNWSVFQSGNFGYGGIALGDVNNDGLMDVGYGMHHNYSGTDLGDQLLEVALGDGTGQNWTPWDDGLATSGEDWGMFGSDFADVDNDGDLDLGSISFGCCNGVHVYLNNGNGTWTQSFAVTGGNSSDVFAFGDVNGDGRPDFAAAHDAGTVYFGDGAGGFTLADGNLPDGPYRRGVALGDVNDDGRADLTFVTSSGGLAVWTWVAPGTWQNLSGSLPASGDFDLAQAADMNLDGHGDVVAFASGEPGLLVVYGGDGGGSWQVLMSMSTPNGCDTAAFRAGTDVDHNGYPDMAYVVEENCQIWVGGINRPRCYAETSVPAAAWVHPKFPRGGETLVAGSVGFVDWHAALPDAVGLPTVTIELSIHGPAGPFATIAADVPNNGRHQWLVPSTLPPSDECYLRWTLNTDPPVTVTTPGAFTVANRTPPTVGDLNCDGAVNSYDIDGFVCALSAQCPYEQSWPLCDRMLADCNGDGEANAYDIDGFIDLVGGG